MVAGASLQTDWSTLERGCAELDALPLRSPGRLAGGVLSLPAGTFEMHDGIDPAACTNHQRLRLLVARNVVFSEIEHLVADVLALPMIVHPRLEVSVDLRMSPYRNLVFDVRIDGVRIGGCALCAGSIQRRLRLLAKRLSSAAEEAPGVPLTMHLVKDKLLVHPRSVWAASISAAAVKYCTLAPGRARSGFIERRIDAILKVAEIWPVETTRPFGG